MVVITNTPGDGKGEKEASDGEMRLASSIKVFRYVFRFLPFACSFCLALRGLSTLDQSKSSRILPRLVIGKLKWLQTD
ncbi:hypothetical protein NDU88_006296 [Pleurodeles waltl]|uniref:Uncharacterized protein n=1 Tax=Pleurodeles waltl TaxID=8319 RepID=A0AAV7N001_PLEWA|nr:hypothetical protein NDU88_006296 [Pleurodeles waltl]